MSASEKLKALIDVRDSAFSSPDELWSALPQIVAVVEGAEGMIDSRFDPERWKWNREKLVAALTALEEALS